MRKMIVTAAALFLVSLAGCCSTNSCGTSGCGTGGGCGAGGCGLFGHGHSHGICDCVYDDYCTSRSPWIRTSHVAPASTPIEVIPAPMPQKLPEGKKKDL